MLVVNGNVFSARGSWIPADSIYARVTPEKYDELVREAKNANFNMLRVWGGASTRGTNFTTPVISTVFCCGTI